MNPEKCTAPTEVPVSFRRFKNLFVMCRFGPLLRVQTNSNLRCRLVGIHQFCRPHRKNCRRNDGLPLLPARMYFTNVPARLHQDCTTWRKETGYALSYPLSPQRSEGRKSGGNSTENRDGA